MLKSIFRYSNANETTSLHTIRVPAIGINNIKEQIVFQKILGFTQRSRSFTFGAHPVRLMIWTPLSVSTMSLISPTLRANVASSKGFCIWFRPKGPATTIWHTFQQCPYHIIINGILFMVRRYCQVIFTNKNPSKQGLFEESKSNFSCKYRHFWEFISFHSKQVT